DEDESDGEGAEVTEEQETEAAAASAKRTTGAKRKTSFSGLGGGKTPGDDLPRPEVGWRMEPGVPGYTEGLVGFGTLANAMDSVRPGSKAVRPNRPARGSFAAQTLARLTRDVEVIHDSHALVAAIERATDERLLDKGSLTAAGGWCAPSEQLYDFCD